MAATADSAGAGLVADDISAGVALASETLEGAGDGSVEETGVAAVASLVVDAAGSTVAEPAEDESIAELELLSDAFGAIAASLVASLLLDELAKAGSDDGAELDADGSLAVGALGARSDDAGEAAAALTGAALADGSTVALGAGAVAGETVDADVGV